MARRGLLSQGLRHMALVSYKEDGQA